ERLRGYGDLGFPWRTLGYCFTCSPCIVQFADLAGVFGIWFWLVLLNTQRYEAWKVPRELASRRKYVLACCLVFVAVAIYDALRSSVHYCRTKPAKWQSYSPMSLSELNGTSATATVFLITFSL